MAAVRVPPTRCRSFAAAPTSGLQVVTALPICVESALLTCAVPIGAATSMRAWRSWSSVVIRSGVGHRADPDSPPGLRHLPGGPTVGTEEPVARVRTHQGAHLGSPVPAEGHPAEGEPEAKEHGHEGQRHRDRAQDHHESACGAEHARGELAGGAAHQLVPLGEDAEVVERAVLSHGILPVPSGSMGHPIGRPDWLLLQPAQRCRTHLDCPESRPGLPAIDVGLGWLELLPEASRRRRRSHAPDIGPLGFGLPGGAARSRLGAGG